PRAVDGADAASRGCGPGAPRRPPGAAGRHRAGPVPQPAGPAGDQAGGTPGAGRVVARRGQSGSDRRFPGVRAGADRGAGRLSLLAPAPAAVAQAYSRRVPADPGNLRRNDPVFQLHRGGKLAVQSTVALSSRADLALAYTPGLARICEATAAERPLAHDLAEPAH